MPKPYPSELCQCAVELVKSGPTVVDIAATLGIAQSCLFRWEQRGLDGCGVRPASGRAQLVDWLPQTSACELSRENKIVRKAAAAVEPVVPPSRKVPSRGRIPR